MDNKTRRSVAKSLLQAAAKLDPRRPVRAGVKLSSSTGNSTKSYGIVKKLQGLLSVVGDDAEAENLIKAFEALANANVPPKMIDELVEEWLDLSRQNLEQQAKANW